MALEKRRTAGPVHVASPSREIDMDWENAEADWERIKANLRVRWGRLTGDDLAGLEGMAGKREHLIGRLRQLYGLSKERVEAELRDWERHQEPIGPVGLAE